MYTQMMQPNELCDTGVLQKSLRHM